MVQLRHGGAFLLTCLFVAIVTHRLEQHPRGEPGWARAASQIRGELRLHKAI